MYFEQFYLTCLSHASYMLGSEGTAAMVDPQRDVEICLEKPKPVAVYCKGAYRSAIAASLLQRAGFEQVMNVTGGFDAWSACHLPFVTDEPAVTAT
jgi:rhodanese-related sulfurtransferase